MNNKQIITLVVVAVAALAVGYFIGTGTSGPKSEGQITMKNQADSLNYFLGLNMGYSLAEAPWDVDADLITSGLNQVINDSSAFDPMSAQNVFRNLNVALSDKEAMKAGKRMSGLSCLPGLLIRSSLNRLSCELMEILHPRPSASSAVSACFGNLLRKTGFSSLAA